MYFTLASPIVTGIHNHKSIDLVIYPNPAKTSITVKAQNTTLPFLVSFTDITGKIVLQAKTNGSNINIASLPEGIYQVSISNAILSVTKKLVVIK